ncbi:hypothetical protein V6N12_045970 [Hibiscus sabdariffa]|uniref:F-box associated domain-containing protein n=1 Tax=Hibiscus sabdariffa TaxID=183260 RepID=A0ABR2G498_9ROSI
MGFDLSAKEFFQGESSIDVSTHPLDVELHELWMMKEYGVVESWTKVLTLHRVDRSYVEGLVLLDKAVNVRSESDVNHPIDSSDSE